MNKMINIYDNQIAQLLDESATIKAKYKRLPRLARKRLSKIHGEINKLYNKRDKLF